MVSRQGDASDRSGVDGESLEELWSMADRLRMLNYHADRPTARSISNLDPISAQI